MTRDDITVVDDQNFGLPPIEHLEACPPDPRILERVLPLLRREGWVLRSESEGGFVAVSLGSIEMPELGPVITNPSKLWGSAA